jgi:aryl-alcohol dehydrogenase-like predicted oxidoreductase
VVRDVAMAHGVKSGQVALAWVLHQGEDLVPIPGTKRRKYLEENLGSADIRLDAAELKRLGEALAPGKVSGPRYAPGPASMVDR